MYDMINSANIVKAKQIALSGSEKDKILVVEYLKVTQFSFKDREKAYQKEEDAQTGMLTRLFSSSKAEMPAKRLEKELFKDPAMFNAKEVNVEYRAKAGYSFALKVMFSNPSKYD